MLKWIDCLPFFFLCYSFIFLLKWEKTNRREIFENVLVRSDGLSQFRITSLKLNGSHFILYICIICAIWRLMFVDYFMLITHHHMHEVTTLFVIVGLMFGYWICLCVCAYCTVLVPSQPIFWLVSVLFFPYCRKHCILFYSIQWN